MKKKISLNWFWSLLIFLFICFFILALVFCVCGYFGWGTQIDGKERKDFVSFCEEYAGLISFIISTSIIIFQSWWNNSIDKEEQTKNRKQSNHLGILSLKHKEKVNILEKFGGNITRQVAYLSP